jgi:hypothetical protein
VEIVWRFTRAIQVVPGRQPNLVSLAVPHLEVPVVVMWCINPQTPSDVVVLEDKRGFDDIDRLVSIHGVSGLGIS